MTLWIYINRKNGCEGKIFRNSSNMARIGTKLCQNAFQTIPDVSFFDAPPKTKSAKNLERKFRFSAIWREFWRATAERTSKSTSTSNFALDRLILRSVRPKNVTLIIFRPYKSFFPRMPARTPNTFSVRDSFPRPQISSDYPFPEFEFEFGFEIKI